MKLYCGDCLEILKTIPDHSVDMILTDPPYGIGYQSNRRVVSEKFQRIAGDEKPFIGFVAEIARILKPTGSAAIFTRWDVQQAFMDALRDAGLKTKSIVIWDKRVHGMGDLKRSFGSRYESILFAPGKEFRFQGKRPQDIVSIARIPPAKLLHPNEKPVALLEWLIGCCVAGGGCILDPFMGSGPCGVASKNMGCDFIGIEIAPEYFAIAKRRIAGMDSESKSTGAGERIWEESEAQPHSAIS